MTRGPCSHTLPAREREKSSKKVKVLGATSAGGQGLGNVHTPMAHHVVNDMPMHAM